MTKLTESYLFARNRHNNVAALNRRIIHSYVILTFIFITINNSGRIICSILVGGGGDFYMKLMQPFIIPVIIASKLVYNNKRYIP
jgi:hypothetical protein